MVAGQGFGQVDPAGQYVFAGQSTHAALPVGMYRPSEQVAIIEVLIAVPVHAVA